MQETIPEQLLLLFQSELFSSHLAQVRHQTFLILNCDQKMFGNASVDKAKCFLCFEVKIVSPSA